MIGELLEVGKGVLSLSKASWLKLALVAAITSSVLGYLAWREGQIKEGGYNLCLADVEAAEEKAEAEQLVILRAAIQKLKDDKKASEKAAKAANVLINDLAKQNRELNYEITNFKAPVTCSDLGSGFRGLFIKSYGAKPEI